MRWRLTLPCIERLLLLRLSGPGLRLCLSTLVLLRLALLTLALLRLTLLTLILPSLALLRLTLFAAAGPAAALRLRGLRRLIPLRARLLRCGRASR